MGWPEQASTQGSTASADLGGMAADPVSEYATPESPPVAAPIPPPLDVAEGVTPPSRRGGARRPLPDVLVEMGYAPAERVEQAQRTGRVTARPAEQLLVEDGTITADQLARAVA